VENASWEQELSALHPKSFGWALACCGYDPLEAEEVLQTSYLKIFSGRARFAGKSSFKTWLFGVIRRTAAEARRANALRRLLSLKAQRLWAADTTTTPMERADEDEVVQLLRRLARRQREVLELVFYQDLSIEEAAAVMRVSVGTARVHYERAKKRLREKMAEQGRRGVA